MIAARQGCRGLALAGLVALALGGCGGGGVKVVKVEPPGELALGMSTRDAIAQLFAVGFAGTGPRAPMVKRLRTRAWGLVVLHATNTVAPVQTRTLVHALTDAGKRGGRPAPLVTAAQPASYPGVSMLPQPEQGSPSVARDEAQAAAKVLRQDGVRAVFSPDADLGLETGPAAGSAFGTDPPLVARLTREAVHGWRAGRVASIVGDFPGEGAASQDPAEGPATVGLGLDDLRDRDLRPFTAAIRAGAAGIQISNALYVAFDGVTPAGLLPDAYALLRRTGFEGVGMTGDLTAATAATGGSVGAAAVDALRAGADVVYVPGDAANQEEAFQAVVRAVDRGRITRARLADALLHVSSLKRQLADHKSG